MNHGDLASRLPASARIRDQQVSFRAKANRLDDQTSPAQA